MRSAACPWSRNNHHSRCRQSDQLLFLCPWAAPAIASPIFGNGSLAPNQAATNSGDAQVPSAEQKKKKSRKQRKLEKSAKARADLIPDILTAKSLNIERTQTNQVANRHAEGVASGTGARSDTSVKPKSSRIL